MIVQAPPLPGQPFDRIVAEWGTANLGRARVRVGLYSRVRLRAEVRARVRARVNRESQLGLGYRVRAEAWAMVW